MGEKGDPLNIAVILSLVWIDHPPLLLRVLEETNVGIVVENVRIIGDSHRLYLGSIGEEGIRFFVGLAPHFEPKTNILPELHEYFFDFFAPKIVVIYALFVSIAVVTLAYNDFESVIRIISYTSGTCKLTTLPGVFRSVNDDA